MPAYSTFAYAVAVLVATAAGYALGPQHPLVMIGAGCETVFFRLLCARKSTTTAWRRGEGGHMHMRLARSLAVVFLCALSWAAWGQASETAETGPSAPVETEAEPSGARAWMEEIPGGGLAAAFAIYFAVAFHLFILSASWLVFVKADQPGWACLLPIYNIIVLLQIAGKPWWWFFLYMIPVVGLIVAILHMIALAESFGKGAGYGIGLFFLPFLFVPLLAFGDAEYSGGDWAAA